MSLKKMRCSEDQPIVLILWLRDQVFDKQPKRTTPSLAMVVVRC
jgi:hypothetical protein